MHLNRYASILPVRAYFGAEEDDDGDGDGGQVSSSGTGSTSTDDTQPETFSRDYVEELRAEAAKHRKARNEVQDQLKKLQSEAEQRKKAEMDDLERLQTEVEEKSERLSHSEALLRQANIENVVLRVANELEFNDPGDAQVMLTLDDLDFDDEGFRPTEASVRKQLKDIAKKKPYLLKSPGSGDGDGAPTNKGDDSDTPSSDYEARVAKHKKDMLARGRVPIEQ